MDKSFKQISKLFKLICVILIFLTYMLLNKRISLLGNIRLML